MYSKITLHGYLGKDPELREVNTKEGTKTRAGFTLGVPRDYGDETDWFYCAAFGKRADVIGKFLRKGSEVVIEGRMESYRNINDGNRLLWNLRVTDFNFCGKNTRKEEAPEGFVEVGEDFDLF